MSQIRKHDSADPGNNQINDAHHTEDVNRLDLGSMVNRSQVSRVSGGRFREDRTNTWPRIPVGHLRIERELLTVRVACTGPLRRHLC